MGQWVTGQELPSIAFFTTFLTGSTHLNGHDVTLTSRNELEHDYSRTDLHNL